jgi:aminopeptidase-like protein
MREMSGAGAGILALTRDLCAFATGVAAPENDAFFRRVAEELPITLHAYASGTDSNGWVVPKTWSVERAIVKRDGETVFNGAGEPLAVAAYSKSFQGTLSWEELREHLISIPELPDAYRYHCLWQYRPWAADWVLSIPHRVYERLGPGSYEVDLVTRYEHGHMLVGECELPGELPETIVFNAHTCHPRMANDDFAGVAVLIRLFQWLQTQKTKYSYRLVLAPEHIGTVHYLANRSEEELNRFVAGAFAEMPGTPGPIKIASTFIGGQTFDRAFANAAQHGTRRHVRVPWRKGAGNDETVWEAPGYEVPFVEVSRSEVQSVHYPEYHTSLDVPDLLDEAQLEEFFDLFREVIYIVENDARLFRRFDGLVCLSNPRMNLYMERPDPAINKHLPADSEKWGHLLDSLLRYFNGSMTVLDIAERHDLPFRPLRDYLQKFEDKDLLTMTFEPLRRVPRKPWQQLIGKAEA